MAFATLMSVSHVASADIFRCAKGDDVRFEQKAVKGYACKRIAVSSFKSTPKAAAPSVASSSLPPIPPGGSAPSSEASLPVSLPGAAPVAVSTANINANANITKRGTIYKRVVNGVVEFSTRRQPGAKVASHYVETCYACAAKPDVNFSKIPLKSGHYDAAIVSAAQKHSIDPAWVRAIIHAESNFNPRAVSHAGAQGLMQLMPATARRFGVSAPFDPLQNISGGTKYLAWLLKRFNGNHTLATAAYNAGEGAVDRYNGIPPYRETRNYVQRVGTLRTRYTSL